VAKLPYLASSLKTDFFLLAGCESVLKLINQLEDFREHYSILHFFSIVKVLLLL